MNKPETEDTILAKAIAKATEQANDAEMRLIGSMLIDPAVIPKVQLSLLKTDFLNNLAALAFDAIVNLHSAKMSIDAGQVAYVIKSQTTENAMVFLAKCSLEGQPSSIDLYVKDVRELATQRALHKLAIRFSEKLQSEHETGTDDVSDSATWMQAQLEQIAVRQSGVEVWKLTDAMDEALATIYEAMTSGVAEGVPTGLETIDGYFGGLFPGELTVLAARPGIGKTALAIQIARHIGQARGAALVFSMEMTRSELSNRQLCAVGSVNGQRIRAGIVDQSDYEKLVAARESMGNCNLYIDDNVTRDVKQICAVAKLINAQDKLAAVFVDYIQIVKPTQATRRMDPRHQVAEVVLNLKWLAKELQVPVMAISMVSRKGGEAGWLQLHHLSESSAIESHANAVWFLQREGEGDNLKCTIDVAKNRGGQVGQREIKYVAKYTRFEDPSVRDTPNYEHSFEEYGS
jgi:replicative DNA helicase